MPASTIRRRNPDSTRHACSHNYVYSFEPKADWSANYATSKEIFKYFTDFADKYGLRKYIRCQHKVVGAEWQQNESEWKLSVQRADGTLFERRCDFLINAAGILNAWRWPAIPGLEQFEGKLLHSAAWDDSVDVAGKHVGLIGNG